MSDKLAGGIKAGRTSVQLPVELRKSADSTEQTGKVYTDVTGSYWRQGGTRTAVTMATLAGPSASYSSGGFVEVDGTNQPGLYRFDVPDAAFATGADWVVVTVKVASTFVQNFMFALETKGAADLNDPSASAIATGVWQDTTSGDFTVASSIGKSLYTSGAVPGAAGGLFIAGSNAATTFATFTVSGASVFLGNVSMADGLTIARSTSNQPALSCTGTGTGAGMRIAGGITGRGIWASGGGTSGEGFAVTTTSGDGILVSPTAGHGLNLAANGASKHGIFSTGGTSGTSDGIKATAGTGGVDIRGAITGDITGTLSTLTTYTGNTPQTGDSFARIGATGSGLTSLAPSSTALSTAVWTGTKAGFIDAAISSVSTGGVSAGAIAAAVFDEATAGHTTAGSYGKLLTDQLNATVGSRMATFPLPTNFAALLINSSGHISRVTLADTVTTYTGNTPQTGDNYARIGAAGAGLTALGDTRLANLDAAISSRMATFSYTAPDNTSVAAIKAKTDLIPSSPAAVGSAMTLTSGERDAIAAALLDLAAGVETGKTVRQTLRLMASALLGKSSNNGSTFRDLGDTKARITATVDGSGNRTAVTLDAT